MQRFVNYYTGIIFFIIFTILGYFYYSVSQIDKDKFLQQIETELKESFSISSEIQKLEVSSFPLPKIKVSGLYLSKGIYIDNLIIDVDLLSVITGNAPKIRYLNIKNAYVNPSKLGISKDNYSSVPEILKKANIGNFKISVEKIWDTAVLNKVIFDRFDVSYSGGNMSIKFHTPEDINFTNNFTFDDSKNSWSHVLKIQNKNFKSEILSRWDEKNISGEFLCDIVNLSEFVSDITPYYEFFLNDFISSTEKVKLSGKFSSEDFKNYDSSFEIQGENIAGRGEISKASSQNDHNLIKIDLDKFVISNLISHKTSFIRTEESIFKLKNSNKKLLISSNNVNFIDENISSFNFLVEYENNSLKISDLSGKFESGGSFKINGNVSSNSLRPEFIGALYIDHTDINKLLAKIGLSSFSSGTSSPVILNSALSATPIDYNFSNSYLNLKGHIITGNLNLKFIGNEKIVIGDITISDIDAQKSDLPFISNTYSYIKSLGMNMYSKDYIQKLVPLRNLKLKSTLTLNLENFTADNVIFDRISAATSFDFGQVKLDDLYLHIKNKLLLKGDARFSATSIQPQIKANLSGGYINLSSLPSDKLDKFLQYLQSDVNLKAFDISIEGKLDYIKFPRLNAQDIEISIDDDKNDILNFKKFHFSTLGSAAKISGNVSLNPIRVSAAFGVDSLDVNKAFEELLPDSIGIRDGRVSFTGQFSSAGDSLRKIIHNGYLNGKFISRNNLFLGVDIPSIVDGLSSVNLSKSSALKIFDSNANSGSSKFKEIRGDYEYSAGIFSFKNVDVAADKYAISAGLAFNIYDQVLDLKSIVSFYPIGARIISTASVPPVKLEMVSKGSIFGAERRLKFIDESDIIRIPSLIRNPFYDIK